MTRPAEPAPTDGQRIIALHGNAELARALLVDSAWCEGCRPLAWQVSMALAGKPWDLIRSARRRRHTNRGRRG